MTTCPLTWITINYQITDRALNYSRKGISSTNDLVKASKESYFLRLILNLICNKVAIKLFDVNASEKSIQKREIDVLNDLKEVENNEGFPKLYDHCTKKSGTYFVTELLGESLLGVQRKFNCNKGMRIKHVLMIGQQLIRRLKLLHSLNYVHGDIKPANLMFGRGKHKNTLYLIDFGLTRHQSKLSSLIRYNYPEEIYEKDKMFLKGNPLYGSVNQHLGWNKVFKKDDVESFLYLLVNIYKGSLPWSCIPAEEANYYEIYQSKKNVDAAELCSGMPKAIQLIFEYIKTLDNYDPINYDMIENNLIEAANECKIKLESPNSHRFHWILESRRETDANKAKLNINLRYIHSVDSIRNMSVSIESIKEKENENNDKESKKDTSNIKKLRKGKGKKKGERLTMRQIK